MKIAIHIDPNPHQDSYAPRWKEALKKHGVEVLELNFRESDIIEKIRGCDGAMWHWFHIPDDKQSAPNILLSIELGLGIPVFPNLRTAWHYDNKVIQHFLIDAIKAPKIPSWVFWRYEDALDFIHHCEYPIIFKLAVGAGSSNVLKLNSFDQAKTYVDKIFKWGVFPGYTLLDKADTEIIPRTFREALTRSKRIIKYAIYALKKEYPPIGQYFMAQKNYAYFQKFLPDNNHDIRITVIGNRAFGYIRHNRPGDFRASGSGNFDVNPQNIPLKTVSIAHQISKDNDFQSMAYDFLLDEHGEYLISEISYCYINWMVHNCSGYWDRDLNWQDGQVWPENAHVEDFIYYLRHKKLP